MQRVSMQLENQFSHKENVTLFTLSQKSSWRFIGIRTFFFLLKLLVVLPIRVKREKADLVLFSSMVTAGLVVFIKPFIRVPLVTINHGHDVTMKFPPYQWFIQRVFKRLDGVISVSRATLYESISRGLHPGKGIALPNGFEFSNNYQASTKTEAAVFFKNEFGIDTNLKPVLLTSGRLVRRKGHTWFIHEVLPRLKTQVNYIIIGDGPEMQSVKNAARSPNVYILGKQPDSILHKAYHLADLFVMPNIRVPGDMEGFGIVMLEANNACTPVIASDLEGIKDVITNGSNGYRVPVGDAAQFAQKIDDVLNGDIKELSEKSRSFVLKHFTWEEVADRYLEFLVKVKNSNE